MPTCQAQAHPFVARDGLAYSFKDRSGGKHNQAQSGDSGGMLQNEADGTHEQISAVQSFKEIANGSSSVVEVQFRARHKVVALYPKPCQCIRAGAAWKTAPSRPIHLAHRIENSVAVLGRAIECGC
jgi:hypothetical protein